jgi:hypothetical protein
MLTDNDIDKLMKVFATKDEVERIVEKKLEPIIETQQAILTGIDTLASAIVGNNLENAARDAQLSRHDGWIRKIAAKAEVELKD